jgi:hypothetical protein
MATALMLTTGPNAATWLGHPGMREPVLLQPAKFHGRYPARLSPAVNRRTTSVLARLVCRSGFRGQWRCAWAMGMRASLLLLV